MSIVNGPVELPAPWSVSWRARFGDYAELTKPRLTLLVLATAAVGYCLGATAPASVGPLAGAVFGVWMVAGGAAALNQYLERDLDGRMERTRRRPLPAGRIAAGEALALGTACLLLGLGWLWFFAGPLTAVLGLASAVIYVFVYTPLKTRTSLNTMVGAVVGGLPPMMGWAAAGGDLSAGAWALFAIVFFWQLPHFFAIAWCHREDYLAAGMKMTGTLDASGRTTAGQVMLFSVALVPISLLPTLTGITGMTYFGAALFLNLGLLGAATALTVRRSRGSARWFFLASVAYLPALFGLMVWDRVTG